MSGVTLTKLLIAFTVSLASAERSLNREVDATQEAYQNQRNKLYHDFPYSYATHSSDSSQQTTEISRDSYVDAPGGYSGFGGGGGGVGSYIGGGGEPASAYQYQIYSSNLGTQGGNAGYDQSSGYGGGGGYGTEVGGLDLKGDGGGLGGGVLALLGLLGLKGLKGVGVAKLLKFLPIFGPILLPILPFILLLLGPILLLFSPILFVLKLPLLILKLPLLLLLGAPFLLLLLPLLFILPVPVLNLRRSLPGQQRINLLESILYRDECVERISCEVSRIVSANGFNAPWMRKFIEKSSRKNKWINRISRAAESVNCNAFSCGIVKSMKETFQMGK